MISMNWSGVMTRFLLTEHPMQVWDFASGKQLYTLQRDLKSKACSKQVQVLIVTLRWTIDNRLNASAC